MKNFILMFTERRYFAAAQLYLSLSLMFGTWVIYIPTITERLNMGEGDLGFALFFSALGAFVAIPVGKRLVSRFGEGVMSLWSTLLYAFFVVLFFIAPSFEVLCVFMFFFGMSSGILQIAINMVVSTLEKEDGVSIMSTCHGFFSMGGIFASGGGTMLLIALGNPVLHVLISASLVVGLQVFSLPKYWRVKHVVEQTEAVTGKGLQGLKSPLLWALAVVALCVMVAEGAIADWSTLFLRDVAFTQVELVGLGYAGFSFTMALGRFMGDSISKKIGAWQLILLGYALSIVGLALVLMASSLVSIGGFLIIGLGFSAIVPEVYRLSSNIEGVNPSSGIAFMAGAGFFGFLAGPVALGAIAEHWGLLFSFYMLLGLVATGALVAAVVRNKSRKTKPEETVCMRAV
jgi:MFS family permease